METATDIQQIIDIEAIKKLPVAKRREIIEAIEDTIEYHEDDVANYANETPEELQILEERLQEYLNNPDDVITLEELQQKFLNRHNVQR